MANETNSLYMNLPVPVVGVDPGPQYAIDIDSCLAIIDQHSHLPGSGILIVSAAIDINADLLFNNNNLTLARAIRFNPQVSPIPATGADLGELYEAGVDLYYNDGAGNQIRITQAGGVAGTPGSISNLTPPASVSYVAIDETFVFQSAALTPANIDVASVILRNLVPSSFGLTLSPPTLGSNYTITLPALPVTTLPISITPSGVMAAAPITFAQLATPVQQMINTVPTIQILSGTGTYTAPTNPAPLWIRVIANGPGGGGAGGGSGGGNGGSGSSATTFGSALLVANAGSGGSTSAGGAGGTASITGPAYGRPQNGGDGCGGGSQALTGGGAGGTNPLGGGGSGGTAGDQGGNGANSSGAGGGGGGAQTSGGGGGSGSGGGAGGYINAIIPNPSATYPYSIGTGGAGGNGVGGTSPGTGGNGADGSISVEEYYGA